MSAASVPSPRTGLALDRATEERSKHLVLSVAALPIMPIDTHIVRVIVGDPQKCEAAMPGHHAGRVAT